MPLATGVNKTIVISKEVTPGVQAAGPGTFDLCHDPVEDRWQLVGCTD